MMWLGLLPGGERSGPPSEAGNCGMRKSQRDEEGAER